MSCSEDNTDCLLKEIAIGQAAFFAGVLWGASAALFGVLLGYLTT